MAETYKCLTHRGIGTGQALVNNYTVAAATTAVVIGLSICNVANGVAVDVVCTHYDGTNDTNIAYHIPILPGATLEIVGGDGRLVLQNAHGVHVTSNLASSLDVTMSLMELT